MSPPPRLGIVGIGLMGASFAAALRRSGYAGEIVGFDPAVRVAPYVDCVANSLEELAQGSETVVVATPVGACAEVFAGLAPVLAPDTVITDLGSVKCAVIDAARAAFGHAPPGFVPGHPIAGAERSGPAARRADLFDGAPVILTPGDWTAPAAVETVAGLWRGVGAVVHCMDAARHDELLAIISHLPHAAAYALVNCVAASSHADDGARYAGGGFRDFTRIAASDAVMWRDICLANRDRLLAALDDFDAQLEQFRALLRADDGDALAAFFKRATAYRARVVP